MEKILTESLDSMRYFMPETFLIFIFLVTLFITIIGHKKELHEVLLLFFGVTMLINLIQVIQQFVLPSNFFFHKMLLLDTMSITLKIIICVSFLIFIGYLWAFPKKYAPEFYPLVLGLAIGLYLVAMTANLLMFYLAIEIVSISSYLLTSSEKQTRNIEGGIKFILFGAISSAIMLYGISLLYGATGTLHFLSPDFNRGLYQANNLFVFVAIFLFLSGLLFKLSIVPFHTWTPDVYQASPISVVALYTITPKIAFFLFFFRFLLNIPIDLQIPLSILSIVSIGVGNFSALRQTNIKRLFAYSSIAHSGFMLIAVLILSKASFDSLVFYLTSYLLATFLVFFLANCVGENTCIEDFRGLGTEKPLFGGLLCIGLISLVGLPPTAGFLAKVTIFSALWDIYQQKHSPILLFLFFFGIINTAIALFYYLKIPYFLFFKEKEETAFSMTWTLNQKIIAIFLSFSILFLFIKADILFSYLVN